MRAKNHKKHFNKQENFVLTENRIYCAIRETRV